MQAQLQGKAGPDVRRKDRPQLERKPRPVLHSLAELKCLIAGNDQHDERADAQGDAT